MVTLTNQQESLIQKLRALKDKYDHDLGVMEAEFEAAKEELKNPIRQAAVAAREAGIPVRQIHRRGLGYEQVSSMAHFLEVKPATVAQRLKRALTEYNAEADGTLVTYTEKARPLVALEKWTNGDVTIWTLVDRDGDEWRFEARRYGRLVVFNDDTIEQANLSGNADEVLDALRKVAREWGAEVIQWDDGKPDERETLTD